MKLRGVLKQSFSIVFFLASFFAALVAEATVEEQLANEGLSTEVHGAPKDLGHYTATVRDPNNFFKFEIYTLFSEDATVNSELSSLSRHDKIRVWGEVKNYGPQKHIKITRFVVETKFQEMPEYQRQAQLPSSFPAANESFRALVHFADKDKKVLVVEYKDAVLPVRVPAQVALPDLYKNDIVEMKAALSAHPESPFHLKVSEIAVKEAIVALHAQPIERSGALVLFPKSPQVKFDIYAVQENLADGLSRQYTIINFENTELFEQIRNKLKGYWDAADQTKIVNGRNKLVNPSLIVKIKGTGNLVDKSQANPQILVDNIENVSLVEN